MAIITYPLNGIMYDASDAETYLCTRRSGVYSAENNFALSVTGDREITIGPGLAWINNADFAGKSVVSNAPVVLAVPVADGALARIDRIVLRFDKAANASDIVIKQGTPASSPAAPAIEQNELVYELGLYTIRNEAASLTVEMADITSTMLDETICGLMRDGVTGLPTEHFEKQWAGLLDRLSELFGDAVGVVSVNGKTGDVTITAEITRAALPASGWSAGTNAAYQQTVTVAGVEDTDEYEADVDMSSATADSGEELLEAWALVGRIVTGGGSVTAYCYGDAPEIDVPIRLRRVV